MPINFPNWANLPTQSSGMGDIFENIMRGAQLSNQPRELRNKNQNAEEMIRQLLLGNEAKEQKNRYFPEELEHESFLRSLEKQYKPNEYQQKMMADILSNKEKNINLETLSERNNAELQAKKASALRSASGQPERATKLYKDLISAGFEPGTKEFQEAARRNMNLPSGEDFGHPDAFSSQGLPASERVLYRKDMNADMSKGAAAEDAIHDAKEMLRILKENPDMSEWWTTDLYDPKARESIYGSMKRRFGNNKKALQQLEIFNKLAADLVLRQTKLEGGSQAATDSYRESVAQSKPSAGLTNGANEYVLNNLVKKYSPYVEYMKDARNIKNKKGILLFDPEYYYEKMKDSDHEQNHIAVEPEDEWEVVQ